MPIKTYKKIGETPKELVDRYKEKTKQKKISFAGRLDPMASGLMILLVGEECKQQDKYLALNKTYEFEILFGFTTDTYDVLGILQSYIKPDIDIINSLDILKYKKKFSQKYPPYSSIVVNKNPLWWWSKNNLIDHIKIPEKMVEIYNLKEIKQDYSNINISGLIVDMINKLSDENKEKFRFNEINSIWQEFFKKNNINPIIKKYCATVSSGTYIRSLCNQIGTDMGCGAIALTIKRTDIMPCNI